MNPEKSYKGCGVVILALFILSLVTNVWLLKRGQVEPEPQVIVEHDTLWRDTTITHPTPTASTQTGRTIFIPYLVTDTIRQNDTLMVEVPVEQKRYDDSLYTAWVSGYQPALDSIRLHQPTIVETITRTIVKPAPRLSIGPAVGAGVSITGTPHLGVYAGFTVQYRLWPK
jgi:hypothetical protein